MLYKNTLVKIKKSFGRYASLFIIVMVGVGFFSGIRGSSPDIIASVDKFYKVNKLMDFKIISTMGLTEDDAMVLKKIKNIKTVIPSYSLDVLDQGKAIKLHAIEKEINTVELIDGRMPQKDSECVADSHKYKIGDQISITSDIRDKLKNTKYTVTGTVKSPLYMAVDYGNTTIGDGKLFSFIYIPKDNFTMEAYTEILIAAANTKNLKAYSDQMESVISKIKGEITAIKSNRENARYEEIYQKASNKIDENQAKLTDKKVTGEKKLANAKTKLDKNDQKLADAKLKLEQSEAKLNKSVKTKNAEIKSAEAKIADGWKKIDAALEDSGISKEELPSKTEELKAGINTMKSQLSQLPADSQEYQQLSAKIAQYEKSYEGLLQLQTSITTLTDKEKQLKEGIKTFHTEIAKAKKKIVDGKSEIKASEKKLENGYDEYNKNLNKFNTKIADAQTKINHAKTDLINIEKAKWYVYDRSAVVGYNDLKSGTDLIVTVADIMPLFFILIVMLMTSNTMARMIVEERGELGTLTSLGYANSRIVFTYLLYVLSATVLGAISGFVVGSSVIPEIIYATFNKFLLPPLIIQYDLLSLLFIIVVTVVLMIGVTVYFCHMELKQQPSVLLRPVSPKHGQKILLEKIGVIWRHLSFTWKVTMRNIFRYKQRVFMTMVGVAGCTALLLVGFGLRDSMSGVAQKQYGQIFNYKAMILLKDETTKINDDLNELLSKEKVQNPVLIKQTTFKTVSKQKKLDTYLLVPKDDKQFYQYYNLKSTLTGKTITLKKDGVVITQRLAEILGMKVGDKIEIQDMDNHAYSMTVADVTENYMMNYIYINPKLYSRVFGENASYNMIVSDFGQDETTLAKHLLDSDLVANVIYTSDILQKAVDGNKSFNNVVILLVVVASMLVIIVLYNLTSINISERKREIATLKVLGFTDKESNQYIYREAFVLTMLSVGIGLLLGIPLHRMLIDTIEGDASVYFKVIHGISFVWVALIIFIVTVIMQIITYIKMRTIDMIESLKAVE